MSKREIALVTGASRGIGRAVCIQLAKDGYDIVFNYQSGQEAALETKRLCEAEGANVCMVQADISSSEECTKLIDKAVEFGEGPVVVLVNNAGITRDNVLMRMKDEEFDAVIDTNLKGTFYMMRGVSKMMLRAKKGRIINMSSVVGVMGNAGQANYSASKAGVIGLTKSVARELSKRGITCNAVAPGFIETEMTEQMPESAKEAVKQQIPLQRTGKVEDIAEMVTFLASEKAAYITGQVISVDGGMSI